MFSLQFHDDLCERNCLSSLTCFYLRSRYVLPRAICPPNSRPPFNAHARNRAAADAADLQARELRTASREREYAAREALLEAREEELRQAIALRSAEILDAHQQVSLAVVASVLNETCQNKSGVGSMLV